MSLSENDEKLENNVPRMVVNSALVHSDNIDESTTKKVEGNVILKSFVKLCHLESTFFYLGFQATELAKAIEEIRKMREWTPDTGVDVNGMALKNHQSRCSIWLSFTSNLISSGLRDIFVYLAKEGLIDVVVTSAGGVEEDFIKCFAPTFIGDFESKGDLLREKGWNRIGNLIVPNENYCYFEDWLQPLLNECLDKQKNEGIHWTPSKLINYLGSRCENESSLYYWCFKNHIPVFSPALTDGSLGDNLYFQSYKNHGLILDVLKDVDLLYKESMKARKVGLILLGGGVGMHHSCMAQLPRGGADFAVFINTGELSLFENKKKVFAAPGHEFDGCYSGSDIGTSIACRFLRPEATAVKVACDATIAFPVIVSNAFPAPKIL